MGKLKISIHPLFFIFGLYFALIGKVFSFIIFTLSALVHELGHYFQSEKVGLKLNKIVLMPYGAIIKSNIEGVSYKDECLIALAGPLINFLVCVFFVALWWVFPETYPYTELVVSANFSLAVINLLPCYPLDGGRLLLAMLSKVVKRNIAKKIVKGLGVTLALMFFATFIYSCFTTVNFTVLFFGLFMLIGAVVETSDGEYVKVFEKFNYKPPKMPRKVNCFVVDENAEISSIYKLLDGAYLKVLVLCKSGKVVLEGEELYNLLIENAGNKTFLEVIKQNRNA